MNKTRMITTCGVMVALSLALDYFSFRTDFTKITLYALPLIIIGLLYGPGFGLLAGVCEGFLSQLLTYGLSLTTPLWMIAAMLWGSLSGLLYKIFKTKEPLKIILSILLTAITVTMVNTGITVIDGLIWNYSSEYIILNIGTRILFSLITSAIYIVITVIILPRLKKFTNKY